MSRHPCRGFAVLCSGVHVQGRVSNALRSVRLVARCTPHLRLVVSCSKLLSTFFCWVLLFFEVVHEVLLLTVQSSAVPQYALWARRFFFESTLTNKDTVNSNCRDTYTHTHMFMGSVRSSGSGSVATRRDRQRAPHACCRFYRAVSCTTSPRLGNATRTRIARKKKKKACTAFFCFCNETCT